MKKIARIILDDDGTITIYFIDYEIREIIKEKEHFKNNFKILIDKIEFSDGFIMDYDYIKKISKLISGLATEKIYDDRFTLVCPPLIEKIEQLDDYSFNCYLENGEIVYFCVLDNDYFKKEKITELSFEDYSVSINDRFIGMDTIYLFGEIIN